MSFDRLFKSPPAEYAPTSFWFWNGALEIPELLRQVEEQNAKGVRGFFMHARGGLASSRYLSKVWMDCIEAVVKRAHQLGCQAWIYDETGWPSGTAGGRIPRKGPAYQQQFLECRVAGVEPRGDYPVDRAPIAASHLDARRLTFHVGRQAHYIDTLKPLTTRAFMRATHEAYYRRVGRFFGKTIPGAFTDEPSHRAYNLRDRVLRTPWTERLPAEFRRRRGYDILPHLASLFFDVGDFTCVRYDFHLTVSELFIEGYGRPLFDWCEAHGIAFTGHYEYEVPIRMQVQCLTSAMPLYEYMQIPGLDLLAKNRPQYERRESIVLAKQPASVANQLGRKRVLVEAFGTAGWDIGPQGLRWMADWLQALGANLICMHGFYYSIAGRRKHDAPPDLFFRQPWWPISRALHDHMARVSLLLTQGKPVRDVLVIHPIATAWITHRPQECAGRCDREDDPLGAAFADTLDALVRSQHDFDLGDERLLARHGSVRDGRLQVGKASYSCVVIPPGVKTLDVSTRALLERLAAAGGTVIAFAPLPRLAAGRRDSDAPDLARFAQVIPRRALPAAFGSMVRVLDRARPNRLRIAGPGARDLALHERLLPGGKRVVFLTNSGTGAAEVLLTLPGVCSVEEWHTTDGSASAVPVVRRARSTELRLRFAPMASHLLVCRSERRSTSLRRARPERVLHEFAPRWQARADQDNVLVLDMCRWRVGDGRWSRLVPVFRANRRLEKTAGGSFALRFEFGNDLSRACRIGLAMENLDGLEVRVNGDPLRAVEDGRFFFDPACLRRDISGCVREGRNVVEIAGAAGGPPLEHAYLLGEFAVRQEGPGRFGVGDAPSGVRSGGWQASGYPFYPGPMTYRQEFTIRAPRARVILEVANLSQAAEVLVNGRAAGRLLWRPFELDITRLLRPGKNELALRVYGSLRNTLGPWHLPGNREIVGYGRDQFEDGAGWMDEYDFIPMGLLGRVRLLTR